MEQSWQANPEIVAQAFSLLQALSNPMRPDHHTALTTLSQNVTQPMFVLHMLYIFAQGYQYEAQGLGVDMRQLAGFIIKNYVFPHLPQLTEDVQQLMKNAFLQALHDSIPDIRRTAAILIGRITESYPATFWIDMVFKMMEYIDAQYLVSQPSSLEGNLMALLLICEDAAHKLANAADANGQSLRPLDTFVPKLVELLAQCHHQQPQLMALGHGEKMQALLNSVRMKALQCYNCLLYLLDTSSGSQTSPSTRSSIQGLRSRNTSMDSERLSSGRNSFANNSRNNSIHNNNSIMAAHQTALNISALILHMQSFMQLLSFFSRDENPEIRKTIVMSITIIAYFHISLLEPYFFSICEFMLSALYDPVDAVGIEACEFWHALLQSNDTKKAMTPFLSQLLPALIFRLKLSQEQLIYERILEEEESKGDKNVSFQPFRYRRRQRYCLNNNNANNSNANPKKNTSVSTSEESDSHNNSQPNVHHNDDDLDNDHQQNSKDANDASSTWTLRKQAALTLDTFAKAFPPQDILSVCLPVIQAMLNIDQTNNNNNNSNGANNNEKKELIPAHLLGPSGEVDMFLQEAGMLALGCLSQGCLSSFRMYMPQLVPLWLHYIDISTPETAAQNPATSANQAQVHKDCVPEMRAIVCWVMSRYIPLLEQEPNVDEEPWFTEEQAQQMYLSCFEKILHHVFDVFPRVQVAASSALSIFISHSFDVHVTTTAPSSPSPGTPIMTRNVLQPYLPTIFQAIAHALETQSLGVKASLLLVDLLGVIAETFPAADIAQRPYVQLILPKVLQLYMRYDTNSVPLSERYMAVYGTHRVPSFAYDVRLFPILESFTSLFSVWGQLMQEYLPFLLDRLMLMAWTTLETNMKQEYKRRMLYHSMVANSPVSPANPTANAQQWPIYVMPDIQSLRTTTAGPTSTTTTAMNNNSNSSSQNNPGFALNLAAIHSPRDLDTPFPSAQPSHRQDTDSDTDEDEEDEDELDLETDDLQKDFTICALDCLSALLENLKQEFFVYVQETYPVLLHILGVVWQDYAQHYVRPFQSHTGVNATNANAGTGGSAVLSKTPSFLVFSPRDNTNMLNSNSNSNNATIANAASHSPHTNNHAVINNSPINSNNANTAVNFNNPNSTTKNDKNIWKMRKSQYYLPELLQASFSVAGELVKSGFWVWSAMPQSVCQVALSNASGNNQSPTNKYTVETTTYFTSLLHSVVFHLDEQDYLDYPFLYNNAAWVLGELLLLLLGLGASSSGYSGSDSGLNPNHNNNITHNINNNSVTVERLRPYLPVLFPALAMAIQTGDLPDTVKSNLAVALGRLCLYFAYDMAELGVAEECFAAWCTVFHPFPPSIWNTHASSSMGMGMTMMIRNQVGNSIPVREKLQAFLGLLLLLRWYPELVTQNKTNCYAFCVALLTFEHDHGVIIDPHHPQNNVTNNNNNNNNSNNNNEAFQMLLHACVNEGHNPVPSVSLSHIVDTPYLWSLVLSNMYKTSSHAAVYAAHPSLPHVHHDTSVPLIPLYVLWALIRGEVTQLLRVVMYNNNNNYNGSDASGVSPVVPPPVSSLSPEMNKMWHRVAQSMKQQFDVGFLQRQFGAQF